MPLLMVVVSTVGFFRSAPSLRSGKSRSNKNIRRVGYIVVLFIYVIPAMEIDRQGKVYGQRESEGTPLWQLLHRHFEEFELRYDELFSRKYGFYLPIISHVVRKYLECGDLQEGFARVRCPDCHHDVLAFSCRGR